MKRLIVSITALVITAFTACAPDDDSNCITCTYAQQQGNDVVNICNENGIAVQDGYNTETSYSVHISTLENNGYTCE